MGGGSCISVVRMGMAGWVVWGAAQETGDVVLSLSG